MTDIEQRQKDLFSIQRSIWNELENAIQNRDHGWRTPILATVDSAGFPDARTVVLRETDALNGKLTIYTDKRSPKVSQILNQPEVSLVFWCRYLNWQLRIQALASVCDDHERIQSVWEQVRLTAGAADYLSIQAPSSPLFNDGLLSENQHALCIIDLHIKFIDWLSLSRNGHKRARFESNQFTRLTP